MRGFVAFQSCITLGTAFFLAPFQHVHAPEAGEAHQHPAVIHAHLYAVRPVADFAAGPQIGNLDDDHAEASSLDTFTLVLTAGFSPFLPTRAPAVVFVRSEFTILAGAVEERVHGPPALDSSIPRAPPV